MTERKRKKLYTLDELEDAVREIGKAAKQEGKQIALAGGLAMQLYGSPRLTADIDIISTSPITILSPEGELSFGGYQSHDRNRVPVDVILRADKYAALYKDALDKAEFNADLGVRVVSAEYLAIMKMVAARPKDEIDVVYLLEENILDIEETQNLLEHHLGPFAVDEFDRLIEQALWMGRKK